jgi:hypothetical protein
LVVDHNCTYLSQISDEWVDSVQARVRMYYVHTSHGGQITDGLESLEGLYPEYSVNIADGYLPSEAGAFCMYDRSGDPKDFWWGDEWKNGPTITRGVLTANPDINVAAFCWCGQMTYKDSAYVAAYCDSMSMLEAEFPGVTFVYMTGNAQSTGDRGYNRHLRNEQIRRYCEENKKVLFDFADLDSWWFNPDTEEWERSTYSYEGYTIPKQHWLWEGEDCGHALWASCRQKAKATWWMMARLVGWDGLVGVEEEHSTTPRVFHLSQNYPNPFDLSTSVNYNLPSECTVEIAIYNIQGQLVRRLMRTEQTAGLHTVAWNGRDDSGARVGSGAYFLRFCASEYAVTRKLHVVR